MFRKAARRAVVKLNCCSA